MKFVLNQLIYYLMNRSINYTFVIIRNNHYVKEYVSSSYKKEDSMKSF
jgi:hypothetical protein